MAPQKSNRPSEPAKKVTQDSRFSHVQEDPRFVRPRKNHSKVKVDKRFAHMIKDRDFTETSKVDRYGRVREDNRVEAQLRSTYDFGSSESESESEDGEEEEKEKPKRGADARFAKAKGLSSGSEDEDESEDESEEDEAEEDESESEDEAPSHIDRARGEGVGSDSESDSESDSDVSDVEWGKFGKGQNGGLSDIEEDPESIPRGDETKRFACVNMDWEHVRAVDLLTVFSAFKPDGGSIVSVKIYPSEFGKERMAQEAVQGPPRDIFGGPKDSKSKGGDEEDSSDDDGDDDESDDEVDLVKEQVDDNEEFDQVALRKYELEKMRYYFAVVECDSVETARAVYSHCDGTEYEASANFFDMRFVPGEMEFDEKPKDEAVHVPEKYEPLDFSTQALQHSKVKLTWDADEPSRMKVTRRAFTQEEIDNMDFGNLLASSSDESSDEEARMQKRSLLLSGLGTSGDGSDSDEDADDGEQEMEITFTPGLSEAAASRLEDRKNAEEEEKARANETTIDRFRRIKKERREKWRESKKAQKTGGDTDLVSDNELDPEAAADSFFTYSDGEEAPGLAAKPQGKKTAGKEDKLTRKQRQEAEAKERAELELLLDGAESGRKHFDMAEIIKAEKSKGRKKGKRSKKIDVEDDFKLDASDPRFSALYDSHNFAIDPNNPNFKKTKAMGQLLSESRKRHKTSYD